MIFGDFNVPDIDWGTSAMIIIGPDTPGCDSRQMFLPNIHEPIRSIFSFNFSKL